MPDTVPAGDHPEVAVPRILCDAHAVTSSLSGVGGALWKLAEPGRQLDANIVHLPPGQRVATHAEPDLDVLLLVVAGPRGAAIAAIDAAFVQDSGRGVRAHSAHADQALHRRRADRWPGRADHRGQ